MPKPRFISLLCRIAIIAAVMGTGFPALAQMSGVELRTVVIDAGHGGHDPGAISLDGKLQEKTVALDVALTLGKMITDAYPDVKVIYTRDRDVFIPLNTRADIANKNHADLFISLHCNSVPKNKTAPSGCETYVMGMSKSESNMEVTKRENSVILMEDDYSTKYQGYDPDNPESFIFFNLMQNAYFEQSLIMAELCQKHLSRGPISTNRGIKQGALLVLWRTTMPSVLVEMGFISNKSDRNTLASKEKRTQIANRIFSAFREFKEQYDGAPVQTVEPVAEPEVENTDSYYAIQIFAISRNLASGASELKGLGEIGKFKTGNLYKYTTGRFRTEQEARAALAAVNSKFKDAFVVKIDDGKVEKVN